MTQEIKLTTDQMRLISLFQNVTKATARDCVEDEEQDKDLNDSATEHKQAKSRTLRCAFCEQTVCGPVIDRNGQTVTVPSINIKCSGQKDRPTRLSQCEDDEESGMSLEAASLDHGEFALDKQAPSDVYVTDPNLDGEVSSSTKTGSGPDRAVPRSGIEEASGGWGGKLIVQEKTKKKKEENTTRRHLTI